MVSESAFANEKFRKYEKYGTYGTEINDVPGIEYASGKRVEMFRYGQVAEKGGDESAAYLFRQCAEQQLETKSDAETDEKCGDGGSGQCRCENADADVAGAHADESDISEKYGTVVYGTQSGNSKVIRQGQQQGDVGNYQVGQKLATNQFRCFYGLGQHQFEATVSFLFGDRAHGQCRNHEELGPVDDGEYRHHSRLSDVEQVVSGKPGVKSANAEEDDIPDVYAPGIEMYV